MKSIDWRAIAESIGILAIVASLIFVGLQLKQDRIVASSQVHMATLETIVAIDTAMSEHADVWVKARNMQDLSETEIHIVDRIVHMAMNKAFFEALATVRIRGGGSAVDFEKAPGPVMEFAVMLHENPGARKIWAESAERSEEAYEKIGNSGRGAFNEVVRDYLLQLQN